MSWFYTIFFLIYFVFIFFFFFFNDTATTEIYTLSTRRSSDLVSDRITLKTGDALELLSEERQQFDIIFNRSEEHTSELQSQFHLVCRLLLEKKKKHIIIYK